MIFRNIFAVIKIMLRAAHSAAVMGANPMCSSLPHHSLGKLARTWPEVLTGSQVLQDAGFGLAALVRNAVAPPV